jgi:hypothetical protein
VTKAKSAMIQTYLKDSGPRNKGALDKAEEVAQEIRDIVLHLIPLENPTFYVAKAIL